MVIKGVVVTINIDTMVVTMEKKASTLEVEHQKQDVQIWVFLLGKCVVFDSKDRALFDFDSYFNLKINAHNKQIRLYSMNPN